MQLIENESVPECGIRAYAVTLRERTISEFDQVNAAQLDQSLDDMGKALDFMSISILKGCDLGIGARFHAFALTKTSLDVLVSALYMARQRAAVETFTLLRVALEAACTSRHILEDEAAYEQYLAGRYKSTRSIGWMKRGIPCAGRLWSAFSQACVHTNVGACGPAYETDADGSDTAAVEFNICGPRQNEPREDAALLTAVSLVAMILLKTLEDNNSESIAGNPAWRQVVGTSLGYFHGTDAKIAQYFESFTRLIEKG